jgi:hypothetical protein
MDKIIAAVAFSPGAADVAIERIESNLPIAFTFAGLDLSGADLVHYIHSLRRTEATLLRFDLVAALYNARDARGGAWPSTWAEAGLAPPIDPRSELPIDLNRTPDGVQIAPRPDGPRTAWLGDLSLELR